VVAALLAALAGVVNLVRQPGSARDNLWAEDGRDFLARAWREPLWQTATQPYAGYLHLYPRLSAAVAAALPADHAATVMAFAGALASSIAVVAVVVGSEGHLRSLAARAGLGLAVALFPAAGYELSANTANAHWYLMAAAFWLLLWTPRTWIGTVAAAAGVLVAGASDPLTGLLAPLALVRLVAGGRGSRVVASAYALGVAVQVPFVLTNPLPSRDPGGTPGVLATTYLERVVAVAVDGYDPRHLVTGNALWAPVVVLLALAAVALVASRRRAATAALVGTCAIWSVLQFTVPTGLRWSAAFPANLHPAIETRYVLGPWLLLVVVGAVAVDALAQRRWAVSAAAWVVWPALILALCLPTLHDGALRKPSYAVQLRLARAACDVTAAPATVRMVSAPDPRWVLPVPCAKIRTR